MKKRENALLLPGERIMDEVTAIFQVRETLGVTYKFGNMIATDKRLILYTKYPLFGHSETVVYQYKEMVWIDPVKLLFSFHDGDSVAVKLVNKGSTKFFFNILKLFADFPLCPREKIVSEGNFTVKD